MSEPFLSSDEYDERAHHLYNEGQYDEAVDVLREGLGLYPYAAELQVGMGYARLAREEYAWARKSFEAAVALDPNHEDALAGLGEVLLKFGDKTGAVRAFDQILSLGFGDDHDLMLQMGRALFRESALEEARRFFDGALAAHPDSAEAAACLGYTSHRLGDEETAFRWLRRALELDSAHAEARIYLANLLYERGEYEASLFHVERTDPEEHFDELAIWRLLELKKSIYKLADDDPELVPWLGRLNELAGEPAPEDLLLAEVEASNPDGTIRDPRQLELFATLLTELQGMHPSPARGEVHRVSTLSGRIYMGTWDEIVSQMMADDDEWAHAGTMQDYMAASAQQSRVRSGFRIPSTDAESFIRGSADAGLLRLLR